MSIKENLRNALTEALKSGDVLRIPFETEYFRGENRGDVVRFARSAVDAGSFEQFYRERVEEVL